MLPENTLPSPGSSTIIVEGRLVPVRTSTKAIIGIIFWGIPSTSIFITDKPYHQKHSLKYIKDNLEKKKNSIV